MSAYKLIEVSKTAEKESQSIYDKETLDEAVVAMHNDFGVAVKQDTTIGAYAVVINNTTGEKVDKLQYGDMIKDRVYTHNNYADDNISAYDSAQLAIGNYHTKLAAQRSNPQCELAITVRLDGLGNFADSDKWEKPVVEE